MSPTPTATSDGMLYAAHGATPAYLCRNDHRPTATPERNRWSLPPQGEYGVFLDAEAKKWRDSRPQLWGLVLGLPEIGLEGRRLAKFPDVQNAADPWHGYPVSAQDPRREIEHRPEPALVDLWRKANLITDTQAARIKRGKV